MTEVNNSPIIFRWNGKSYSIPAKNKLIVLSNGQVLSALSWDERKPEAKTVALKLEYTLNMTNPDVDLKMVAAGLSAVLAIEL